MVLNTNPYRERERRIKEKVKNRLARINEIVRDRTLSESDSLYLEQKILMKGYIQLAHLVAELNNSVESGRLLAKAKLAKNCAYCGLLKAKTDEEGVVINPNVIFNPSPIQLRKRNATMRKYDRGVYETCKILDRRMA